MPSPNSSVPCDDRRIGEAEAVVLGAEVGRVVFGARPVGRHLGIADVMAAALVDDDAALGRQPVEAEGGEEQMQQARVIGIAHVADIHLPVVGQDLAVGAQDLDRLAHHAARCARRSRGRDRFRAAAPRRRSVPKTRPQKLSTRSARRFHSRALEIRGHAALAGDAALERDGGEVAFEVVGPAVIDAADARAVAALAWADERAAMGAAVLEGAEACRPCRARRSPARRRRRSRDNRRASAARPRGRDSSRSRREKCARARRA